MAEPFPADFGEPVEDEYSSPEDSRLSQHDQTLQFIDFNPEAE